MLPAFLQFLASICAGAILQNLQLSFLVLGDIHNSSGEGLSKTVFKAKDKKMDGI